VELNTVNVIFFSSSQTSQRSFIESVIRLFVSAVNIILLVLFYLGPRINQTSLISISVMANESKLVFYRSIRMQNSQPNGNTVH